jgi:hypothetical protein
MVSQALVQSKLFYGLGKANESGKAQRIPPRAPRRRLLQGKL